MVQSPPKVIRRGQIWWYKPNFDQAVLSPHIQKGNRPVIVVSDDALNATSPCAVVVPCTTQMKRNFPTQVPFLIRDTLNVARCEQIFTCDKNELDNMVGYVEGYIMEFVDVAIKRAIGMSPVPVTDNRVSVNITPPVITPPEEKKPEPPTPTPAPKAPEPAEHPVIPSKTVFTVQPVADAITRTVIIDKDPQQKRRVWDAPAQDAFVEEVDRDGIMFTAKRYGLTSATAQNYYSKFRRSQNVAGQS